jgi:16S rRNA U1498 N3-methylase RsmE
MSTYSPILIQTGEQGVRLRFTVRRNGAIVDLTGGTVLLFVDGQGSKTCTIVDATAGRADYIVQPGDWPHGLYAAQLQVTVASGIFKGQRFDLRVEEAVA